MTEKKDWFGLYYQNQNANYTDFLQHDIKPSDVVLNDKDTYKKNDKIIQAFTDNEGKFNEDAFNNFYNQALSSYNTFALGNFVDNTLPEIEYDIMSAIRRPQDKVQQIDLTINKKRNPFIETQGINSVLGSTESNLSSYEIAQSNLIWDSEKQSWMDKSPEDLGFWGTINETPIVFARYEEDTEEIDPNTGRKINHYKGEMKLDENGSPYYETLGNRAAHNKEFLSPFNVLTKEGSTANKFDFLDNDGRDKSVTGTIAQTVATIAPMLIPYVGQAYTYGLIAKNAAQLGITLYKMVDGVMNPDKKDYEYGILNTIEGKLSSFSPGTSEYSKEHMISFENFGNLISDVSSQLFQQRLLAQIPRKLGFGNPEKAALKKTRELFGDDIADEILTSGKLSNSEILKELMRKVPDIAKVARTAATRNNIYGKWLSSFYMSGISTMDVFNAGLDAGYDREASALTAALAMAATTWMIGSTEIGQVALKGLGFDAERQIYREVGMRFAKEVGDKAKVLAHAPIKDTKLLNSLLKKAGSMYKGAADAVSKGGLLGNAIAEGLEEMSEELIMDSSKEFTDAITSVFGIQEDAGFEFLKSNPLERYFMAGAGGMVGGAIFKLANKSSDVNKNLPKDVKEQMFYFISNGMKSEMEDALEYARIKGVAPKELSNIQEVIDGEIRYKPATGNGDSLNDNVIDLALNLLNEWDGIINQESLNLSEDDILERVSLKDKRIKNLLEFEGSYQITKDFNDIGTQIVELVKENSELRDQISPGKGKEGINVESAEAKIKQNEAKLLELRKQKDDLLNGSRTEEYLRKSLFYLSSFKDPILATDINTYSKYVIVKDYNTLSEAEKSDVNKRYSKYKDDFDSKFNEGYTIFKEMTKKYGKELMAIAEQNPLLEGIKSYLSEAGEEALLNLNEEALHQFNIDKQLNTEKGIPISRGLEYIIKHDNVAFSNPEVKNIINSFFQNLSVKSNGKDIKVGVDISSLLSSGSKFSDLNVEFINDIVMSTISKKEDGTLAPFGELLVNIENEIKSNADKETPENPSDIIKFRVGEFIDTNIKNDAFKELLNNVLSSNYSPDHNQYLRNIKLGIDGINFAYNHELVPQLKIASAKMLLEESKSKGTELTKDLYQQLLSYIKPDNEFELNKESLDFAFSGSVDESVEGAFRIEDISEERFGELGLSPDVYNFAVGIFDDMGFSDMRVLSETVEKLKSAKSWFDVAEIINNSSISNKGKLTLTNYLNDANSKNTKATLSELNLISSYAVKEDKLKNNPITELLKKVEVDVLGTNDTISVYDLLENENSNLKSAAKLSEFVIQGKVKSDQILKAIETIDLLKSIISSSIRSTDIDETGFGYNTVINRFRQQFEGDQEILPEIDQSIANNILWQLNRISNQLNFFKKISDRNVGNKLREHKLTAIRTRQALLRNFLDSNFTIKRPEVFEGVTEIINLYDAEELFNSDLNDDSFIRLEELITRVEDKIYDNINTLTSENKFTKQQIIEDLFKGNDFSNLVKGEYNNPLPLNDQIKELSTSELFTYYHVISTLKSSDYDIALKEVVDEEMKGESSKFLIPIFSQEFASKINIAMAIDPEFMNNITIIDSDRLNSIKSFRSRTIYKNYIDIYKNLVFNNGAPGVGKTNGVGKLTYKVLNKILGHQNVVLVGPQSQQVINLTNAILDTGFNDSVDVNTVNSEINKENNIAHDKNQFLSTIYKDPSVLSSANEDFETDKKNSEYVDHVELEEENFQMYRLKPKYLDKSNFNDDAYKDQRIIFIDEVTNFSKFELQAITAWAHNNNKILITFGDLLQTGYNRESDGLYLGIDVDSLKVSTPTLSTSLRTSNIHKKDNVIALRVLDEQIYNRDVLAPKERIKLAKENLKSFPSLKYYEDDKVLHGEKITESTSMSELEKLVNSTSKSIGYIYDDTNSDTYKLISEFNRSHPKKIKMFKLNKVQGLESPYFIVDLHFNFNLDQNIESNIKNLYTALTRSEDGTIIINNGLTKTMPNGSSKLNYTQESILNNESAKSFSELRLKSLEAVLKNYTKPTPTSEPKSKTSTSDTKPSNVTLEKILDDVFDPDEEKSTVLTERIYKEDSKVRSHPDDSFISYSYDGRIKETPILSTSGNIISYSIKSDVVKSGLYNLDHTGFFNGNYSSLNADQFRKVDKTVQSMKSILYSFKSKERRDEEFNKINSEANNIFREVTGNTGSLDLKNGKFRLQAIKYFNDGSINPEGSNRSDRLRVVYTIPILNSSTSQQQIELFVYSLPNGSDTKYEGQSWFKRYKPFYSKAMSKVTSDYTKLYTTNYIPLSDDFELEKITNLVIYKKDPEGRKHYNFEDRGTQFKGLYFSNPYVVVDYSTDKSKRNSELQNVSNRISEAYNSYLETLNKYNSTADLDEKKSIKKELQSKVLKLNYEQSRNNLKGKAVVFATYAEKIYDSNGNLIPESEYGDYYARQMSGEFDNDPDMRDKIRMIVLSPNPLTFRQFYNNYDKYIKESKVTSNKGELFKFYKSFFGDYTGFDVILSILNYKNWLEVNDKTDSKHYEIANRLYKGLLALSNSSSPQLTNTKPGATEFHIMRIMERLREEINSKTVEEYRSTAEKINGADVLYYLREIINSKIREESGKYAREYIENESNSSIFFTFGPDISSNNIFDFMESALIGKVGDRVIPDYNPLFKNGIYSFPVMMYDKDQQGHTGDKNFIRAVNLEGSYYIDRDLQTPQFAFVVSRDLANPEEFGYKRTETSPKPTPKPASPTSGLRSTMSTSSTSATSTTTETVETVETESGTTTVDSTETTKPAEDSSTTEIDVSTESDSSSELKSRSIENTVINLREEANKFLDKDLGNKLSNSLNRILYNSESINSESRLTTEVNKILRDINTDLKTTPVPYNSTENISYIEYKNGKFIIYTSPRLSENSEESTRKSDENRLYLRNNFGDMFNIDITDSDLNSLVDNFKLIEMNTNEPNIIKEFIQTGRYSPELVRLLTNENISSALMDINRIRSKYNIC